MESSDHSIEYVYILGASHSGTTLLAMLLGAHPEVATIGELASGGVSNTNGYLCSCGALLEECRFWRRVGREMGRQKMSFGLNEFGTRFDIAKRGFITRVVNAEHRGRFLEAVRDTILAVSPRWRRTLRQIHRYYYALGSTILEISAADILVDSSKTAHWLKFVLGVPSLNVRVVHLVRDGRAVALTYMDQDSFGDAENPTLRHGGTGLDGPATSAKLSMARAADEWRRCVRSAEFVLAGLDPSRWIRVHYEDLCTDPEGELARIAEFVKLDQRGFRKGFRSVKQHVIGNGMRLDSTSEVRLDDRWKSVLSQRGLDIFDRVAGDLNRRYGYV